MSRALNYPKKGTKIKVEPIRELKDLQTIKKLLVNKPRDRCLFILGINTNLRGSDLLNLRVSQVRGLKSGDDLEVREKKTGKLRRITLNKASVSAIQGLLASRPYLDENFLFLGQRGVMSVSYLNRLVKSWCNAINLKGSFGSHTLRKTWGYHQRVSFNTDIPTLMTCFNHSTQRQTLDYLCIQPEEIKSVYMNEI